MPSFEGDLRAAEGARFAIVASRWNSRITEALIEGARSGFKANGVDEAQIDLVRVPGAWELPVTCAALAKGGRHVGIVALGCVVRGDTRHYEHVADGCSQGLMQVALEHGVPVANGVLAVEQYEDAEARAGGAHGNKGEETAFVVLEMSNLLERLK
ncbi:MAG: 6,7-dimethyl-8-ribityllumazine synthase [Proteobacteria bacterium]|nr:6,7-dimethyl-8-ribityllumazine synthase [Pseudomonadota bacterium]